MQTKQEVGISKEGILDFESVSKVLNEGMEQRIDAIQRAVSLGMIKPWSCPECTFLNKSYPSICEQCNTPNKNYKGITIWDIEEREKDVLKSTSEIENSIVEMFQQNFPESKNGKVLLAVIHCNNIEQTLENIQLAKDSGVDGVFLINHGFPYEGLIEYAHAAVKKFPDYWIGLNLLGINAQTVFKVIPSTLMPHIRGIWVDDAGIDERKSDKEQDYAKRVVMAAQKGKFKGLYFGGVAFKYQREVKELEDAAKAAYPWMHVVTTSGPGTGKAAHVDKIVRIRSAIGKHPLGLASGVTAENIGEFLPYVDCFLVATGISKSFHDLDEIKVRQLVDIIKKYEVNK